MCPRETAYIDYLKCFYSESLCVCVFVVVRVLPLSLMESGRRGRSSCAHAPSHLLMDIYLSVHQKVSLSLSFSLLWLSNVPSSPSWRGTCRENCGMVNFHFFPRFFSSPPSFPSAPVKRLMIHPSAGSLRFLSPPFYTQEKQKKNDGQLSGLFSERTRIGKAAWTIQMRGWGASFQVLSDCRPFQSFCTAERSSLPIQLPHCFTPKSPLK